MVKYLHLVLLCLIIITSCTKDKRYDTSTEEPTVDQLLLIQQHFVESGYDSILNSFKADDIEFNRSIDWDNSLFQNEGEHIYVFSQILTTDLQKRLPVVEINFRNYLITKVGNDGVEFSEGSFISQDSSFNSNFDGFLVLRSSRNAAHSLEFSNGVRVPQPTSNQKKTMSLGAAGIYEDCRMIHTCDWYGVCNGVVYFEKYTSEIGCAPPAPGITSCTLMSWIPRELTSREICTPIGDWDIPVVPFPRDWDLPEGKEKIYERLTKPGSVIPSYSKELLSQVIDDCIGRFLIGKLVEKGKKFTFVDSTIFPPHIGEYSPFTGDIKVDQVVANAGVMFEELFHGYQDVFYDGTEKYVRNNSPVPGSLNIEFEAKVLNDIVKRTNGRTNLQNMPASRDTDYLLWIAKITSNGTSYPSDVKELYPEYLTFMKKFRIEKSQYKNFVIDEKMEPSALFTILKANCL